MYLVGTWTPVISPVRTRTLLSLQRVLKSLNVRVLMKLSRWAVAAEWRGTHLRAAACAVVEAAFRRRKPLSNVFRTGCEEKLDNYHVKSEEPVLTPNNNRVVHVPGIRRRIKCVVERVPETTERIPLKINFVESEVHWVVCRTNLKQIEMFDNAPRNPGEEDVSDLKMPRNCRVNKVLKQGSDRVESLESGFDIFFIARTRTMWAYGNVFQGEVSAVTFDCVSLERVEREVEHEYQPHLHLGEFKILWVVMLCVFYPSEYETLRMWKECTYGTPLQPQYPSIIVWCKQKSSVRMSSVWNIHEVSRTPKPLRLEKVQERITGNDSATSDEAHRFEVDTCADVDGSITHSYNRELPTKRNEGQDEGRRRCSTTERREERGSGGGESTTMKEVNEKWNQQQSMTPTQSRSPPCWAKPHADVLARNLAYERPAVHAELRAWAQLQTTASEGTRCMRTPLPKRNKRIYLRKEKKTQVRHERPKIRSANLKSHVPDAKSGVQSSERGVNAEIPHGDLCPRRKLDALAQGKSAGRAKTVDAPRLLGKKRTPHLCPRATLSAIEGAQAHDVGFLRCLPHKPPPPRAVRPLPGTMREERPSGYVPRSAWARRAEGHEGQVGDITARWKKQKKELQGSAEGRARDTTRSGRWEKPQEADEHERSKSKANKSQAVKRRFSPNRTRKPTQKPHRATKKDETRQGGERAVEGAQKPRMREGQAPHRRQDGGHANAPRSSKDTNGALCRTKRGAGATAIHASPKVEGRKKEESRGKANSWVSEEYGGEQLHGRVITVAQALDAIVWRCRAVGGVGFWIAGLGVVGMPQDIRRWRRKQALDEREAPSGEEDVRERGKHRCTQREEG
ncbi:hypothetical protein K438DRAFT_1780084 [Mycena galopus ATCC 62051]|nr:hypothetical protein K438DRAFT_1780084 [Mycena galopus ATCC 62051]